MTLPRTRPRTIAIDGPASSGKTTISRHIAEQLGYLFVDTGILYRAITYAVLQKAIQVEDDASLQQLLQGLHLQLVPTKEAEYHILLNGEEVTTQLRSKNVEDYVSQVAQVPLIREAILPLQRRIATQGEIILAGRDIGTVVLPDADLKLYIDASLEERSQRRYKEKIEAGVETTLESVRQQLAMRDRIDSERSTAPLTQAEDAIYILTDGKSFEEVITLIMDIIHQWEG